MIDFSMESVASNAPVAAHTDKAGGGMSINT